MVSSTPPAVSRAICMFPPSGRREAGHQQLAVGSASMAVARLIGPQLKVSRPSPANVVSSEPFGLSRATATWKSESPTSTILPSG